MYENSDALRKRFKFIFQAVSKKMRSNLTEQRTSMNLTELKNYGETSDIRKYFKNMKAIATNLATLSLLNSNGELVRICKKTTEICKCYFLRFTTVEIKGKDPRK